MRVRVRVRVCESGIAKTPHDAWIWGQSFTRMRFQGNPNATMAPIGRKTGLEKKSGEGAIVVGPAIHHISL